MSTSKPTSKPAALTPSEREALLNAAKIALQQAYAPYSKFHVGASVLTEKGSIYSGCNVENASYGLTNCAERTAIFSAVAAEGPTMRLRAVAVASDPSCACAPCGACRQVIFEFGAQAVVLYPGKEHVEEKLACELLPDGFAL